MRHLGGVIYTDQFHEDWYMRSSNIEVFLRNVRGCNVGTTDKRDL
jgi:hypothetical protein